MQGYKSNIIKIAVGASFLLILIMGVVFLIKPNYTVSFIGLDGEVLYSEKVQKGKTIDEINPPDKQGYTFTYWYDSVDSNKPFTFDTPILKDTTLYAKYLPSDKTPYYVDIYLQDLSGSTYTLSNTLKLSGTTDSYVTAPIESMDGFSLNLLKSRDFMSGYVQGDGSLRLTQYYDRNIYHITFDSNGGSSSVTFTDIAYGNIIEEPLVTKEGYRLLGWYQNNELYDFSSPIENSFTLVATWEICTYNISIEINNLNAGSVMGSGSYQYGSTVFLSALPFSGYNFIGWYVGEELLSQNREYSFNIVDQHMVINAVFTPIEYMITYELDGGTNDPLNPSYITVQDSIALLNPVKEGYDFVGWYLDQDLSLTLTDGYLSEINQTVTLYASWATKGLFYEVIDEEHVAVSKGMVTDSNVMIPKRYFGMIVKEISPFGFADADFISRISLPDSIEKIGAFAFFGTSITEIRLPQVISEIGYGALVTLSLTKITIDNEEQSEYFKTIDNVLYDKSGQILIQFPTGFEGETFEIPFGVKVIDNRAFAYSKLKTIIIPTTVNEIRESAFTFSDIETYIFIEG